MEMTKETKEEVPLWKIRRAFLSHSLYCQSIGYDVYDIKMFENSPFFHLAYCY